MPVTFSGVKAPRPAPQPHPPICRRPARRGRHRRLISRGHRRRRQTPRRRWWPRGPACARHHRDSSASASAAAQGGAQAAPPGTRPGARGARGDVMSRIASAPDSAINHCMLAFTNASLLTPTCVPRNPLRRPCLPRIRRLRAWRTRPGSPCRAATQPAAAHVRAARRSTASLGPGRASES